LKITCLGSGGAFTLNNYHSNFLLEANSGKKMLIDCGSDVRHALFELGYTYKDIDAVYISHLHGDHCGGLEWLGFSKFFDKTQSKPKLFASNNLDVWKTLEESMDTINDLEYKELHDYFDRNVYYEQPGEKFQWEQISFEIIPRFHIKKRDIVKKSYGLNIDDKVYFSSDAIFNNYMELFLNTNTELILHECETYYIDGSPFKSNVHSHYEDLKQLPLTIKEKMWLYHYSDNAPTILDPVKDGFKGFINKGQIFEI